MGKRYPWQWMQIHWMDIESYIEWFIEQLKHDKYAMEK